MEEKEFRRSLQQMEKCKKEGYDCSLCEYKDDCAFATEWFCEGCEKKTTYKTAYAVVFN
jgi:ribosomal protein L37AE/L43A